MRPFGLFNSCGALGAPVLCVAGFLCLVAPGAEDLLAVFLAACAFSLPRPFAERFSHEARKLVARQHSAEEFG
ncbi:hypothetical protein A3734_14730 [Sulfitobacter sp. HI0054]|nr:hypothetical protein A3734_14730 [Sulfitobacter sp. HI0054]